MFRPNLKFVALPIPEIIAMGVLGGGCEPQILRTGMENIAIFSKISKKSKISKISDIFDIQCESKKNPPP